MKLETELYIHIPFCERKCSYCDFLSFNAAPQIREDYVKALIAELEAVSEECRDRTVISIFFGGGTPSMLHEAFIVRIMNTIREHFDIAANAEITIECNPASALGHKLAAYKKAGINRLSIGLQSADNAELRMLGRIHTFEDFLKTFQAARMEGFSNINIDLINCFPLQSINTWKKTLKTVLMLKPEHVSIYNLIVEPGTPFYEMQEKGILMMPSEEEQAKIDEYTVSCMKRSGFRRYEFSNWAKPGYECRHNTGYWTGVQYIGTGLGASSYFNGCRWKNTSDISEYLKADIEGSPEEALRQIRKDTVRLDKKERMEEFMYLGLRCIDGISGMAFLGKFGMHIEEVYGEQLERFIGLGLMENEDGQYRLTERGIEVSNVILSEFLLPD